MTKPQNPPAFPLLRREYSDEPKMYFDKSEGGMTLRDYFAAYALQGIIASGKASLRTMIDEQPNLANAAYEIADLMLKVRGQND